MEAVRSAGENLAAFSYIPLIGWIYPYFFRKEDELVSFHARQAMQLNVAIVAAYFFIWIIEYFPLTAIFFGPGSILHPISRTAWLLVIFAYIIFSVVAAYQAYSSNKWNIPYLQKGIEKSIDYVKGLRKGS